MPWIPWIGLALSLLIGVALGFFGGGGSILMVPLLAYGFGLPAKVAIASSLLIVALGSVGGALQHARAGNLRLRTALPFGLAGMLGAYAGGRAGAWFDGSVLLLLFAGAMVLTGVGMWRGRRGPGGGAAHAPGRLVLQGLAVGSFTGLVGAGGGFLIVPALVLWARLPVPAAIGTSLFVVVGNSLAGFAGYASHVSVPLRLVASVAACTLVGAWLGTHLVGRLPPTLVRRSFSVFVLLMALGIGVREGSLLLEAGREALPRTGPQLLFALVMLGVGVLAGRATRNGGAHLEQRDFEHGGGI